MRPGPCIGAHLSTAGGLWCAVERAVQLECAALQMFTQPPGRWRGRTISEEEVARFRDRLEEAGLQENTFAHAPYLINVASPDDELWRRSVALLADQLDRAAVLGLAGVVIHPGAHTGSGVEAGIARAAAAIERAFDLAPNGPRLLLETTAGQGTVLGASFEEIGRILDRLPGSRTGVCWDTAHLWGAGWNLLEADEWERLWEESRRWTGRDVPDAVHLNDTPVELGSHRDRHERIGSGRLGEPGFARIVSDARLEGTPMILETPKGPDGTTWDREALELLRRLVHGGVGEDFGSATRQREKGSA